MATKVLIVEDNPVNLGLATLLLEQAGFEVIVAGTAEEGIVLAHTETPDVIVMDIGLPGMDGLEATRILKADPETQDIPVLAATAHAMTRDEETTLAAGCDGYVSKPLDTRTFAETVAGLLRATASE
jgi:CheY-like chemotaxis protein